ncbi:hypothetical protein DCS_08109 [Drechmeria coniospora]|uniref:Uncharacterized protein n=1 Tax=Drechmeria coniospora TaxID=98403 RepID=A0A151GGE7_DRECN|nr:hypothetical protein DCS_08109 [Drechmeria coniospora]KYK56142.1 hypothetical protein DCS_08109 [Drechmeria coniospora]
MPVELPCPWSEHATVAGTGRRHVGTALAGVPVLVTFRRGAFHFWADRKGSRHAKPSQHLD